MSSLLVGALSLVLADAGSQPQPATNASQPTLAAASDGFALTLPGGTLCFGQPRGVRCDRHWPDPEPPPPPPPARAATGKKSWHFTVLDRTLCLGPAPKGVQCTVHLDPEAPSVTRKAA